MGKLSNFMGIPSKNVFENIPQFWAIKCKKNTFNAFLHKNIEYEDWSRKTSCPLSCLFLKYFLTDLPISQNKEVSYWHWQWLKGTNQQ